MNFNSPSFYLIPILVALAAGLGLTPLVRFVARRFGAVARPKADRWHTQPTAMLGGIAIFLATVAATPFIEMTLGMRVVVFASALLFVVGLVDDFLHIKPYQKLIGQIMGAAIVTYFGIVLPWTASFPINMGITILWLIGITNAINLLDNMDGLAAGIAAIAAAFLAAYFLDSGQTSEAVMLGVFAAALVGFLVYNSNPASIFMGDCGSMFIGFFLASGALLSSSTGGRSRSFLPVLAVPVLVLFVPIFDTTFVTILRKLAGRSVSQGGLDHTSHRLVALGMSERRAVWMLYGFAAAAGLLAMLVRNAALDVSLAVIGGFSVLLILLGVYLGGVKVYSEEEMATARERPLVSFLVDLSYKRRVFEVLLDVAIIAIAYYAAYAFVFGPVADDLDWRIFLQTLPVLVVIKLAANLVTGVYRGLWRYTSLNDLVTYAKSAALGSVASILVILFAFRFQGFSRTVFAVDCVLMFVGLAGSRVIFRFFRQVLPVRHAREGRRALIYGAGDGGELLLREALNNPELRLVPIGFIDDDPRKRGKVIHGLRVWGGNGHLRRICQEQNAEEVVISSTRFPAERIAEILRECQAQQITLKRMRIDLEELGDD